MEHIPFHVPSLGEDDIPGVVEVLRRGWVTTGPRCREFEQEFAQFLGGDVHCIAVNSCTAGLHLALEAIGVGPGDLVVTTPYTFTTTAEVVRYLGADVSFVDVDPETFNLQPEAVEAHLQSMPASERARVKAILPVHYAGLPCDMTGFSALAEREGLRLVDDAAHALPTRHQGRWIGTFGDASAFSFYATKTLCTGEGGMVVTPHEELAQRMRVMRLHGISRDVFDRYTSTAPAWYYEVVEPGFKYNLTDIAAALGLSQLRKVGQFRDRRADIARRYTAGLTGVEGLQGPPDAADPDEHSWHLYALRLAGGRAVRDAFIEEMAEAGISTSVHFIPLHLHPYWRDRYRLTPADLPVATQVFEQEVSLPIYPAMTDDQVQRVVDVVPQALHRARTREAV